MPARVAFKRMIPFAGVATTATLVCYGADRAFAFQHTPVKRSTLRAIESGIETVTLVMLYRHFRPNWQIICAASAYGVYSGFCKEMCTRIFDGCKGEWDRIKVVDEASNLETRDEKSLDGEDSSVEDTTS
ncbi:hypothetical protein BGAL_0589g00100 [Botrytis galanthina]|uniref:Uncharacterized protein n=1 Tax=Botrytis galanthina TaxID=278940 RepID=A0A4S8QMF8_9HELO|nr:hypothetical protein BGAL_0589g00100 [Botrytis galanthina]